MPSRSNLFLSIVAGQSIARNFIKANEAGSTGPNTVLETAENRLQYSAISAELSGAGREAFAIFLAENAPKLSSVVGNDTFVEKLKAESTAASKRKQQMKELEGLIPQMASSFASCGEFYEARVVPEGAEGYVIELHFEELPLERDNSRDAWNVSYRLTETFADIADGISKSVTKRFPAWARTKVAGTDRPMVEFRLFADSQMGDIPVHTVGSRTGPRAAEG